MQAGVGTEYKAWTTVDDQLPEHSIKPEKVTVKRVSSSGEEYKHTFGPEAARKFTAKIGEHVTRRALAEKSGDNNKQAA